MAQSTKDQQLRRDAERVRAEIGYLRQDLEQTLDQLGDRASPKRMVQRRKARLRERVGSARETVMGSAQQAAATVQQGAQGNVDQATSAVANVAEQARQAPEKMVRQGNPLAAGAVAFGLGLLVATVLPVSDPERDAAGALQPKLEPLKDRALEMGQELKGQVQEAASEGVEHVKETATEAAQQVKEDTQSAGEHMKQQAQDSVQETREQTTS